MRILNFFVFLVSSLNFLSLSRASTQGFECTFYADEFTRPIIVGRSPDGMYQTNVSGRSIESADKTKLIVSNQSDYMDWEHKKKYRLEGRVFELGLQVSYHPAMEQHPEFETSQSVYLKDGYTFKFSVLDEEKEETKASSFYFQDSQRSPAHFSLDVGSEYDFGGKFTYNFKAKCLSKEEIKKQLKN